MIPGSRVDDNRRLTNHTATFNTGLGESMNDLARAKWVEDPANPLLEPPGRHWIVGDPSLLTPDRSPDGRWHMFANAVLQVLHFVSDDGIKWESVGGFLFRGFRTYIHREGDIFYLFYELHAKALRRSVLVVRTSADLLLWSEPRVLLEPTAVWDGRRGIRFIGNPCLIKIGDTFRLYYSSGWVFVREALVFEPAYIGVAEADKILGPYKKRPVPLIGPDPDHPWRNLGAGSLKIYSRDDGGFWAFNNGIYRGPDGHHGSAILLLESADGYIFREVKPEPIVKPEPGWKAGWVYAFDLTRYEGETRLYFNARDGQLRAKERIGMVRAIGSEENVKTRRIT